jgi:hypothetical protein
MATLSLLDLPVELLHCIFYHLNAWTIFRSLRYVCKQFYAITNTHNTLRLNSDYIRESDCRLISRIIQPSMITSLILTRDANCVQMKYFLSHFNMHQFTRLHSLFLYDIHDNELKQFLQHIPNCSLISLGIGSKIESFVRSKMLSSILSTIVGSNLRNLYLDYFDFALNPTFWSIQCPLRRLTIDKCVNVDYRVILDHLPHLQTFVMRYCTMTNTNNQSVLLSDRHTTNKSSGIKNHLTIFKNIHSLLHERKEICFFLLNLFLYCNPNTIKYLIFSFSVQIYENILVIYDIISIQMRIDTIAANKSNANLEVNLTFKVLKITLENE